eukprot:gene13508-biopygen6121
MIPDNVRGRLVPGRCPRIPFRPVAVLGPAQPAQLARPGPPDTRVGGGGPCWEIVGERGGDAGGAAPQEWMYAFAAMGPDPWEGHNEALRLWIRGRGKEARERAAGAAAAAGGDAELREALLRLGGRISDGAMPSRHLR